MREYPSLVDRRFGKLTVVKQVESTQSGRRQWLCACDCGGTHVVTTENLNSGHTTNCGCLKSPDLTGKVFGRLTVLGRSDKYGSRGKRKTRLWECRCECGEITYKATDTLNNPDLSMCQKCAAAYAAAAARAGAGFVEGTQLSKIRVTDEKSDNLSGVRGIYLDSKKNRYRVRIQLQGKVYNLGSYSNLEDAVKARRRGEEDYFGAFLDSLEEE